MVVSRTWARRLEIASLALAVALLLLVTANAYAHGKLKSAQPAVGSRLSVAPTELRLEFTEAPEVALARFDLVGPGGTAIALGPLVRATGDRRTLIAPIQGGLTSGTYTVKWRIAGADGHPVTGTYQFTIATDAAGLATAAPDAAATSGVSASDSTMTAHHDPQAMPQGPGFGVNSPAYVAVRWLLYAGLLIVIGAVAFHFIVLRLFARTSRADASLIHTIRTRAARAGLIGAGVVGVAAILRLVAQSYAMHGNADAWAPGLMMTMLTRTMWGYGWLLQLAGAVVAAAGFVVARRGSTRGWAVAAVGALMLAVTPALSGHAISSPKWTELVVLADTLHVIGAGGWLGSLLMLVAVAVPAALKLEENLRGPAVADLVNAFSPTALIFAGLAGATGLFSGWMHLGSIPALWQSTYGQTLMVKLAILSVVVGTGAYNWLRVRPALGDVKGAARIRRSGTVELVTGLAVLLVTAVLVATSTPMDAAAMSSATIR